MSNKPNICDYADTNYSKDFWGNNKRLYEDIVERNALHKLLPAQGNSFLDMGAGFGRLTDEYAIRYKKVTLFDYAQNLLDEAKIKHKKYHNIDYVQGDIYNLPFKDETFDGGLSVRVMHHIEDVSKVFAELNRVMQKNGKFVLEYANKHNVLEIIRFLTFQKNAGPFKLAPAKRGNSVFWNFHPLHIEGELKKAGFKIEKVLSVSMFRSAFLKKVFGDKLLARIENHLSGILGRLRLSPSVFLLIKKE